MNFESLTNIFSILGYFSVIWTLVIIIYGYFTGDSFTQFMSTSNEKLITKIVRILIILIYSLSISIILFLNILANSGIEISMLEFSDENERYYFILLFLTVVITMFAICMSLVKIGSTFVNYNKHAIVKKGDFFIILDEKYNNQLLEGDKLFLSIPSKKETLCINEIELDGKKEYRRVYLDNEYLKKHTIFSEEKLSPAEKTNRSREQLLNNLSETKLLIIPILLLFIFLIITIAHFSKLVFINGGFRTVEIQLLSLMYIPFILAYSLFLWWFTGKRVISFIFSVSIDVIKKIVFWNNSQDE